jgi:surface polysaccharide O-acyltransferase-like enzyme
VIISNTKAPYTLGFIFLYLLGAYLHKYGIGSKFCRLLLYAGGLLGVVVTIFGTWLLPGFGLPSDLLISFFAPNVMVSAAAFFVFIQQFCSAVPAMPQTLRGFIHKLAGCTMGVYVIHPLVLMILQRYVEPKYFSTTPYLLIPQRAIFVISLSFFVVWIARKIPVLKQLF